MQNPFINLRILAYVNAQGGQTIDLPYPVLSNLAEGEYQAANVLKKLAERGAVHFEDVGDEGFKPITYTSSGPRIHECIAEEIDAISKLYAESVLATDAEKGRVANLVGFDLDGIRNSLDKLNNEIGKAAELAETSEGLRYLKPEIGNLAKSFVSLRAVLNGYEDIYRNVLKPIQKEGEKSLKATAKWAIIGIVLSTIASIILTYITRA